MLSDVINILVYELTLAKENWPVHPANCGSLIACSFVRAVTIEPGLAVYGSTKAAIGLLVEGFASEVGRFGVRVNAIAPCIAETAIAGFAGPFVRPGRGAIRSRAAQRL